MKKILLGLLFIAGQQYVNSQNLLGTAKEAMSLEIVGTSGTNAVAVTYNPKTALYYTVFAGNNVYPLEVFSKSGEFISTQEAGFDSRGMWYNKKTNSLEGVSYPDSQEHSIKLTSSGQLGQLTNGTVLYKEETNAVAAYNEKSKKVLFVTSDGEVKLYKKGSTTATSIRLLIENQQNYNFKAPIYTNVKGKELGLFNHETLRVDFFNLKTGAMSGSVKINLYDSNTSFEIPAAFRVSYANNMVWVYNAGDRVWYGYQIWD